MNVSSAGNMLFLRGDRAMHEKRYLSVCGAVGSLLDLELRCRRFESSHTDQMRINFNW